METQIVRDGEVADSSAVHSRQARRRPSRQISTLVPAAPAAEPKLRTARPAGPAPAWDDIGPGWMLAMVNRGDRDGDIPCPRRRGAGRLRAAIYLLDAAGGEATVLTSFRAVAGQSLAAWSGGLHRALLSHPAGDVTIVREVDLESGAMLHEFSLSSGARVSYTRPKGLGILVDDGGVISWVDFDRLAESNASAGAIEGRRCGVLEADLAPCPTVARIDTRVDALGELGAVSVVPYPSHDDS
jgi:hypothetical protein